jgi:inhibitor of KinA sporulation pathway (predicted exonuclease)
VETINPLEEKVVIYQSMNFKAKDVHGVVLPPSLRLKGIAPKEAMKKFADWIAKVSGERKPIFVGSPIAFDWCFVNYYFIKFLGYNPFGVSGIDLKSVWIGKTNSKWHVTTIDNIKKKLGLENIAHTHNALEDAKEQSKIFDKMMGPTSI